MAFPSSTLSTTFVGANEDPLSQSGRWATGAYWEPSKNNLQLLSNTATGHATNTSQSYVNQTFNATQEVWGVIDAKYTTGSLYMAMNMASPNTSGVDGYWMFLYSNAGTDTLEVNRIDNGGFVLLLAITPTVAVGDGFGMRHLPSGVIEVWRRPAGFPTWLLLNNQVTDSTYLARGYVGLACDRNTEAWSSFGGGDTNPEIQAGTLTLTGGLPVIVNTQSPIVTPTAGVIALTGGTLVPVRTFTALPTAGQLTLAGGTATVVSTMAVVRTPTVGSLTLTGGTPTATATTGGGTTITPTVGSITLTGGQPGVAFKGIDSGTLTLAGGTPAATVNTAGSVTVVPTAGALTLTGGTLSLLRTFVTLPTAGQIALTGGTPTVINGLSPVATPTAGALNVTGGTPTVVLVQSLVASPDSGALTLAGGTMTTLVREPAALQSGTVTLQGGRPRAINSGNTTTGGVPGGVLRYRYTLPDHPQQA